MHATAARAVEQASGTRDDRAPWRLLVLTFLVGFVACEAWAWRPSLWTDEAATISASTRTLAELTHMAGNIDAVHATYYGLMHVWLQVLPADALWLRLPSALAVGATAVGVLLIGRRLGGATLGVLAAGVFVLLPRTTWAGLEARPFAFSALAAVAATWVLLVVVTRSARRSASVRLTWLLAGYGALIGLGIALNVYVGLLLLAHGMSLLLTRSSWSLRLGWALAGLGGVLVSSPLVWVATHQTGQLGGGDLGLLTLLRNVVVNQWFLGETPTLGSGVDLASAGVLWKPASVALALVVWSVVGLGLLRAPTAAPVRWAAPWIVLPTVVIGLYSLGVHNMYNPRYLTFASAGVAVLAAHGLLQLTSSRVRAALVLVAVVLATPVYVSQRQLNAKSGADWSQVAAYVQAHSEPGQGVYFAPRYVIDGPLVRQTTRGIATAYPQDFVGLVDVTLVSSPVVSDDLTGRSSLLAASATRWQPLQSLWVVRRVDYAYKTQDDQTLRDAGFGPVSQWDGPLDQVIEYKKGAR